MRALTANARRVLAHRYLRRDAAGHLVEDPEACLLRVAAAVGRAEARFDPRAEATWRERFAEALLDLDFLPNSPTLMNAGTQDAQLFACFVLPVGDGREALEETKRVMASVQRTGGGTGFSLARVRPRAEGGPGVAHVLSELDAITRDVSREGRRRGANMGVLPVQHPEILAFVRAKEADGALATFNLSVGLPDAFLEAVAEDGTWALRDPRTGRAVQHVGARELFEEIARSAWATGDPGVLFLDAIERANPVPGRGRLEATNPCGEVPLRPWESCNLASISLPRFLRDAPGGPALDTSRLGEVAQLVLRFLDDALEVNAFPHPALGRAARATRKIGVGVMGWAEVLFRMGLPYAGEGAVALAHEVMALLARATREASAELARTRGTFPAWDGSRASKQGLAVRHATTTSIAPTGTISLIAGTTPGIEPLFALAFRRRHVLGEETLETVEPLLVAHVRARCRDPDTVLRHVEARGTLPADVDLAASERALFRTALEIPGAAHVRMQAAFQAHVDNAVSKTVNLPTSAGAGEVAALYRLAHAEGLKGLTVFRHGCRAQQVVELGVSCPAG